MLLKLPEDMLSHVSGFLTPRDFYNTKTAVSSGLSTVQRDQLNCIYWWREEVPLQRAVLAGCPSLVRWVVRCDTEMEPEEVIIACDLLSTTLELPYSIVIPTQIALHDALRVRWPAYLSTMMGKWVDTANTHMFNYQIARAPRAATADVLDLIYTHERWLMLAIAFRYAPRAFILWAFGNYREAADAELVANMRFVMYHLETRDRIVLTHILRKYHDWLWCNKLDRAATLQTIASLHSLECAGARIVPFDPSSAPQKTGGTGTRPVSYFHLAARSPVHDFLEYLLLRGLEVEPAMLQQTHDLKKLRLMMAAQFVQKYQKIMVMILVLVAAIVLNIFTQSELRPPLGDPKSSSHSSEIQKIK
jgi:hypothetical protein